MCYGSAGYKRRIAELHRYIAAERTAVTKFRDGIGFYIYGFAERIGDATPAVGNHQAYRNRAIGCIGYRWVLLGGELAIAQVPPPGNDGESVGNIRGVLQGYRSLRTDELVFDRGMRFIHHKNIFRFHPHAVITRPRYQGNGMKSGCCEGIYRVLRVDGISFHVPVPSADTAIGQNRTQVVEECGLPEAYRIRKIKIHHRQPFYDHPYSGIRLAAFQR